MEPGGNSQDDGKHPSFTSSSYPVTFTQPSPPPSAHGSVEYRNHIWGLPPSRAEPSATTSVPSPPSINLPPVIANHNFTPPGTASSFGRSNLPSHLHTGSDGASIDTWITAANTEELAGDDDDFDDTNFVYENGRRYHANAEGRIMYPLPNDESEQEREDMNHKLALWMMHDKLFYAPIEGILEQQGGTVFDLGESHSGSIPPLLLPLRLISPDDRSTTTAAHTRTIQKKIRSAVNLASIWPCLNLPYHKAVCAAQLSRVRQAYVHSSSGRLLAFCAPLAPREYCHTEGMLCGP